MSIEYSIHQLQEEIKHVERIIMVLARQKKVKEYLVDDLRRLVDRVSEESSFLIPFKPLVEGPQLTEKVLTLAKGTRKYSEESGFSTLSKCGSHTTKANSIYQEDDICWDYEHGSLVLSKECSKLESGNGKNKETKSSKKIKAFEIKNLLSRQKNNRMSRSNLCLTEESHFKTVFKFWNENLLQMSNKAKSNYELYSN